MFIFLAFLATQAQAITREQIMENAKTFAEVVWTCSSANVNHPYTSGGCQPCDFYAGGTFRGEAYSYGGNDSVERFLQRIAAGDGAGSHLCHYNYYGGVPPWATGIDCSAYVSRCWEIPRQSTATLPNYSTEIARSQLKQGDILNKPHSHVRLFDMRAPDGRPIVYEASGSAAKVVRRAVYWGDYTPRRFDQLFVQAPPYLVKRIGPQMAEIVWQKFPDISRVKVFTSTDGRSFNFLEEESDSSFTIDSLMPDQPTYVRLVSIDTTGEESSPGEVLAVQTGNRVPKVLLVYGYDRQKSTNTRNFIRLHAAPVSENGLSFESCSNEMVENGTVDLSDYTFVDWILGEESTADHTFSAAEQEKAEAYLEGGGGLFVSGSEIAWDLDYKNNGREFFRNYLKSQYVRDDAKRFSVTGISGETLSPLGSFRFGDGTHGTYLVKYADCISPVNGGRADLLYTGTSYTAGVDFEGTFGTGTEIGRVMYWGFPFETITIDSVRKKAMGRILGFMGFTIAGVNPESHSSGAPDRFYLSAVFPNPVRQRTLYSSGVTLQVRLSNSQIPATISVYNVLGQLIVKQKILQPGSHRFVWKGKNQLGQPVSSGLYLYQIQVGNRRFSRKISILK
ncbi:MAG: T9SS type A sorting domain-containing protein [Calditrichaeota bacterium]|nr:T9SS type A sorting domain-containing protein [Calditrichota bacterium]